MILTIRTDKPESEIGLFDGQEKLAYQTWQAHRQLAETIHKKLQELLESKNKKLEDITGVVIYKGPGSFTGLRIGVSVANALAYARDVPVVASEGEGWIASGTESIISQPSKLPVTPEYGQPVHITQQKK